MDETGHCQVWTTLRVTSLYISAHWIK